VRKKKRKGLLSQHIKAGYPHLKASSGLPEWLLPEGSLNETADEVDDSGLLMMARPLRMADGAERLANNDVVLSTMSAEAWQQAIANWPHLSELRAVIEVFLEVSGTVTAQFPRIRSKIEPMVICRSMAVLLYAPLVDEGESVLGEIAGALGSDATDPAQLIRTYADAVIREDITNLERVNEIIIRQSAWSKWAAEVEHQVLSCRNTPRLIAVTPPLSSGLASILASMIEEGQDGPGGDHPEHPGNQMPAQ